jgi:hypothetical protein
MRCIITQLKPFHLLLPAASSAFLTWPRQDITAVMVPIWAGYCCQNICDFHYFFSETVVRANHCYSVFKKYHFTFSICVSWFVFFKMKYHMNHAMALAVSCLLPIATTRVRF